MRPCCYDWSVDRLYPLECDHSESNFEEPNYDPNSFDETNYNKDDPSDRIDISYSFMLIEYPNVEFKDDIMKKSKNLSAEELYESNNFPKANTKLTDDIVLFIFVLYKERIRSSLLIKDINSYNAYKKIIDHMKITKNKTKINCCKILLKNIENLYIDYMFILLKKKVYIKTYYIIIGNKLNESENNIKLLISKSKYLDKFLSEVHGVVESAKYVDESFSHIKKDFSHLFVDVKKLVAPLPVKLLLCQPLKKRLLEHQEIANKAENFLRIMSGTVPLTYCF